MAADWSICTSSDAYIDFSSLIEIVKRVISNLPAIEVFFSTEFIYKKIGEDVNLFKTIDFGIQSIMTMLNELDKEISVEPSQARKTLLDKIDKLFFYKVPQEAWFVDDYVYYKDGNFFEKGHKFEMITSSSTGVKYSVLWAHLQSSVFKLSKDLIDSIHEEGIVAYTA